MARKQAVVLIHGIGEQIPMANLKAFVHAVWSTDDSIHNPYGSREVWSKPDDISGSFELRRLTTGRNRAEIRTDFFEYYWAHLAQDTKMGQVTGWLRAVLLRPPRRIPAPLRPVWWVLAGTALTAAILLGLYGVPDLQSWVPGPAWLGTLAVGLIAATWTSFLVSYVGDAARYLHGAPGNVEMRQRIRTKGVELLKKLQDSGQYERIILVGHSLGSVIGYDILAYLWTLRENRPDPGPSGSKTAALERLVELARTAPLDADAYRRAQPAYLREMQENGSKWLISDFITLGCPLTHAELLLAESADDLKARRASRELPSCPPVLEGKGDKRSFAHPPQRPSGQPASIPHHAAPFAPTRWTNLYFPSRWLIWGDPIGGSLAPLFGSGIRDLEVETPLRRGLFTHTLYWSWPKGGGATPAVVGLRRALGLAGDTPVGMQTGERDDGPDGRPSQSDSE